MVNVKLKTLQYFCSSQLDVLFEIHDVLSNSTHAEHQHVLKDLEALDEDELAEFVREHDTDSMINEKEDRDQARRLMYLTDIIHRQVAAAILHEISSDAERQRPYDSINLKELSIDKYQLVSTKDFRESEGLVHNRWAYELCPITPSSNSGYWLYNAIVQVAVKQSIDFRIRLHPFKEIPVEEYHPMHYKMMVYGIPLDWDKLKNIESDEHGRWLNEKDYYDYLFTDYVWNPKGKEIHFTCEELPKKISLAIRGSRYFHAILDRESGKITHCDGAIRLYTENELDYRNHFHVRQPEVRKIGKRIKIFQVDKSCLHQEDFVLLVKSFFVWNQDVQAYFS